MCFLARTGTAEARIKFGRTCTRRGLSAACDCDALTAFPSRQQTAKCHSSRDSISERRCLEGASHLIQMLILLVPERVAAQHTDSGRETKAHSGF